MSLEILENNCHINLHFLSHVYTMTFSNSFKVMIAFEIHQYFSSFKECLHELTTSAQIFFSTIILEIKF